MVYGTYGDKVVRKATLADKDAIYNILEPLVCDKTQSESIYGTQKRQLLQLLKFYIKQKNSAVIDIEGKTVSCYIGNGNSIVYVANTDGHPETLGILMYHITTLLHNRFQESVFQVYLPSQKEQFKKMSYIEFKDNVGIISLESKDKIDKLFNKIKEYYE